MVLLTQLQGSLVQTLAKQGRRLANPFFAIRDDPAGPALIDRLDDLGEQRLEFSPQRLLQLLR